MGHILNLLVQEGLKEDCYQKLVGHCSALVRYINKSEPARRRLKDNEAYYGMPDLSMIQSSNVRWNTVVDMLERVSRLYIPLQDVLVEKNEKQLLLTPSQFVKISELICFLIYLST